MKSVWKFPVSTAVPGVCTLDLPAKAEPLSFQEQGGSLVLWALVDPAAPTERRTFRLAWTGEEWEAPRWTDFIGTAQCNGLVWHLFEVPE